MSIEKNPRGYVQSKALRIFSELPKNKIRRGTICLSTGTGKSKVAIDFITENADIKNVLITSPRTNLKQNWKKELNKWGWSDWSERVWSKDSRVVNITIENIQTVYKWKNQSYDIIIADEIHTMMTPEYSQAFENLKYRNLMGLTATHDITNKNDKQEYYDKYAPILYEYYDSAEDGLINKTRYVVVDHVLSNDDQILINIKGKRFFKGEADHYQYLTDRIKNGQKLMMQQGSEDWFTDAGNWFWKGKGTKEQKFAAMMYLNSITYRKDFLLNLPSSAKIARRVKDMILEHNSESKVLIFSELTNQVEMITKNTIHSHNKDEINERRLSKFNAGTIRDLGSCQSLTLGLNLKGATHAIMESYIGSSTRSKQKKGRLDRLATDKIAEMWIVRVLGTQSEKWFDQMSKNLITNGDVVYVPSTKILKDEFDYNEVAI